MCAGEIESNWFSQESWTKHLCDGTLPHPHTSTYTKISQKKIPVSLCPSLHSVPSPCSIISNDLPLHPVKNLPWCFATSTFYALMFVFPFDCQRLVSSLMFFSVLLLTCPPYSTYVVFSRRSSVLLRNVVFWSCRVDPSCSFPLVVTKKQDVLWVRCRLFSVSLRMVVSHSFSVFSLLFLTPASWKCLPQPICSFSLISHSYWQKQAHTATRHPSKVCVIQLLKCCHSELQFSHVGRHLSKSSPRVHLIAQRLLVHCSEV